MGENILNLEKSIVEHMTGYAPKGAKMIKCFDYEWEYNITRIKVRYTIAEEPTRLEYCLIRLLYSGGLEKEQLAKKLGLETSKQYDKTVLENIVRNKSNILSISGNTVELKSDLKGRLIEEMKINHEYESEVEKWKDEERGRTEIRWPDKNYKIENYEEISGTYPDKTIKKMLKIGIFENEETESRSVVVYDKECYEVEERLSEWLNDEKNKLVLRQMTKNIE